MRQINQSELPLDLKTENIVLDEKLIQLFNSALHRSRATPPLTVGARALCGMFTILNDLDVDWKKLLHVSQKFEYYETMKAGSEYQVKTSLTRYRERAGSAWLSFEIELFSDDTGKKLIGKSMSQIMVGLS